MAKNSATLTVSRVEKALLATHGLKAKAAEKLKCSPSTISKFLKKHPKVEETIEKAVEAMLDTAEGKLFKHIEEGNIPALLFYLKCKGKGRGYVEKDQTVTLEAMRAVMEKMASVVVTNVSDHATLRAIQEEWDSLSL